MPIEKGTIKVVWITKNAKQIHSKMFDSLGEAKTFAGKKKSYLVFRLLKQKRMQEFSWALVPHGEYRLYEKALRFYQRRGSRLLEKFFR